jgi:hypothetical protein
MTIFRCVGCRQPLTDEVESGEPVQGPERPAGHAIASPRMAAGTFKVSFDARLLIVHPDDLPGSRGTLMHGVLPVAAGLRAFRPGRPQPCLQWLRCRSGDQGVGLLDRQLCRADRRRHY